MYNIILEDFTFNKTFEYHIDENLTIFDLKNIICKKLNYNYKKLNMKIINTKNNKFNIVSYDNDDDIILNLFSKSDIEFIKIIFMDQNIFTRSRQYLHFVHNLCTSTQTNNDDNNFVIIQKYNGEYYQHNEFVYFLEMVKTQFPEFINNIKKDNTNVINYVDDFILRIVNMEKSEFENIKYKNLFVYYTNQIFL